MNDLISRQAAISHFQRIVESCSLDCDYNKGFVDGIEFCSNFIGFLSSEQPEPRWIPCEKRLPDDATSVLVTLKNHTVTRAWWNGHSWANNTSKNLRTVIAWMPLVEPYKEEDDNE